MGGMAYVIKGGGGVWLWFGYALVMVGMFFFSPPPRLLEGGLSGKNTYLW